MPKTYSPFLDGRLALYTVRQILLSPFALVRQGLRYLDPRLHQRFVAEAWTVRVQTPGPTSRALEKGGIHLVFVGPTVGEFRIMAALGDEIARRRPDVRVTYCLRDPLSFDQIARDRPDASLCFRPVDFMPVAARWTRRFRPDVMVFVGGMRFPALTWTARLGGSANVLVDGRSSARKGRLYGLREPYFRWLFEPFELLLMRSEADRANAARWMRDGRTVVALGELKPALPPEKPSEELLRSLSEWLNPDLSPILAAGSTADADEERMVVEAFLLARKSAPCRLLIAPRQVERAPGLLAALAKTGLRISSRTHPAPNAEVFVLDTLGELATAYSFCLTAYIGGAMRGNGHNLFEALVCGIPVVYGPRRGEFETMQLLCEAEDLGARMSDANDLQAFWERVLTDEDYRTEVRQKTAVIASENGTPFRRTVEEICALVDRRTRVRE